MLFCNQKLYYLRPDLLVEEVLPLLLLSPDERLLLPELLELTADLVWLLPEELLELTDRGACGVLEIFLLETFADDLLLLPLFFTTEELFTALLFETSAVFREVLIPLFAEELVANLLDAFVATLREISEPFMAEL